MRIRMGLVAVAVGMLVGTGVPSQWQAAECATSSVQKGPDLNRSETKHAAASGPSQCESALITVPPHLAEKEGGPPLKVQDGEHLIGTASLGGKQYQLKAVFAKGRSTDLFLTSGGKRLQGRAGAPPQGLQECLRKQGLGWQGPQGWYRWVRDIFVLVPEAEAAHCTYRLVKMTETVGNTTVHSVIVLGCNCAGRGCTVLAVIED